jgi:hypothetical protein
MYLIFFLIYYVIYIYKFYISFKNFNQIKLVYFFKFVGHKINSKMINFRMMVLTEKKNTDMTNADVSLG